MNFGAHAMQNSVKATVDSLRLPTFQNFEIRIPPTLKEQHSIAAILSDMDAETAALEAKLAKARNIKQGMMQELLTGRIRLV
jgi:type I restriction enzyme, S subunit